jgi:hypothetical protein
MKERKGNDAREVRAALARAVATRGVSDKAIDGAAKRLASIKYPIRRIDICAYGICLDYVFDRVDWGILDDLVEVEDAIVRGVEVFPLGIPVPDLLHVRVTHELNEFPRA